MLSYDSYILSTYLSPLWEGNVVYNETVLFVNETEAPLLYIPEKILSVRSFDLATEYKKGVDYLLRDGKLVLTKNTSIPSYTEEEYYPPVQIPGKAFDSAVEGHPYILFNNDSEIFRHQIQVTYTHKDTWQGFLPTKTDKLDRFLDRAKRGDDARVLFFGDSITTGVNSSGAVNCPPYADTWMEMTFKAMRERLGNDRLQYLNTAVGGKNTPWALEVLTERVLDLQPDLLFLAFGMNDIHRPPAEEARLISEILDKVKAACPDCDVALVSPMLPHFRMKGFFGYQPQFEAAFKDICDTREHTALIPVTSMHNEALKTKRYYDMTGNNVNHPNDFLARIYAQTALRVLFG